ncbi:hypothetical protein VC83_09005 [Pseudogymnoascus destructans]|uniref:Serine aminopeptidase S33 domain-containing protein n=2 Tax=Pseudogymnoascus destructans TaxID=655981 RepID=L8FY95_PSED2|nr:uncharacterized protein VC83_09005 [Pseudogymnoascus destructans]ELR05842.1 hypothetical protein GMDG_07615 [Pseudogymnoascus destructans 20631-21]OAF54488.2 hypothetical protein VC83_09005 [Pseudogymnoascus destructans]
MSMSAHGSAAPSYLELLTSFGVTCASWMRVPVMVSSGFAVILSSALYFKQKALIYPSHVPGDARTKVPKPSHYGIDNYEDLQIPTPDGEKLSAFFIRAPNQAQAVPTTVLMFHGNAGNIGHRVPIAQMIAELMGCSVFMLEYRGYGLSTGSPDERGLMIDAQTALDYLTNRHETKNNKIVVYGQSLGGAVSIQLVAKNQKSGKISGLILENTFLSMRKLIPSVIPPARYLALLCHQIWPSETIIPTITEVPVLFISGLKDEMVPPEHMRKLYELCQSPTKIWKPIEEGDHNSSVMEPGYFHAIQTFMESLEGHGDFSQMEKDRKSVQVERKV